MRHESGICSQPVGKKVRDVVRSPLLVASRGPRGMRGGDAPRALARNSTRGRVLCPPRVDWYIEWFLGVDLPQIGSLVSEGFLEGK